MNKLCHYIPPCCNAFRFEAIGVFQNCVGCNGRQRTLHRAIPYRGTICNSTVTEGSLLRDRYIRTISISFLSAYPCRPFLYKRQRLANIPLGVLCQPTTPEISSPYNKRFLSLLLLCISSFSLFHQHFCATFPRNAIKHDHLNQGSCVLCCPLRPSPQLSI